MLKSASPHRTVHFAIDVETRRSVVAVSGTLTAAAALAAVESVRSLASPEGTCVTLDLGAVTHVVPRALRELESGLDDLRRRNISVRVTAAPGSVARGVLQSACSLLDHDDAPPGRA